MPPKKIKKIESESSIEDSNLSEEITDDLVSKKAKEDYQKNDFFEKIIKYIKFDDLIRKETVEYREKVNSLKEQKLELETFILRYLDTIEQDTINIGGDNKITKYESVRTCALNEEIIKNCIFEQLKKENIVKDENKCKELVENTFNLMQNKREKKSKICLKRTIAKPKKVKQKKKGTK
jgi:hypothetical protein